MENAQLSLDERQEKLTRFIEKYQRRGYEIVSRSPTTVEMFKPARFPAFLFPEHTYYIDIEPDGVIYVRKS